jgi:dipeptidyl aminopeptidase/acylaminoacyl peptidase
MKTTTIILLFASLLSSAHLSALISTKKIDGLTLRQTVELKRVGSVKVSPNGQHIAYTLIVPRESRFEEDGKHHIELYVGSGSGNEKPRIFVAGNQRLGQITWDADSQYIYFIAQRHQDKYVNLYRIPVAGGEVSKVVSAQTDIISFTIGNSGKIITYLAKRQDDDKIDKLAQRGFKANIFEESLINSQAFVVLIDSPKTPHIRLRIKEHIRKLQYAPNSDRLLVLVAPTALVDDRYVASQYRIYYPDGTLDKVIKIDGKLGMAQWSTDGKHIAIIAAADRNDPAVGRIYIVNANSGDVTQVIKNYPGHIKALKWTSAKKILFIGNYRTQSELSELNLETLTVKTIFQKEKIVITAMDTDRSGSLVAAMVNSDAYPSEVAIITNHQMKRWSYSNSILQLLNKPKQTTISYKARDGVELDGVLIYPSNYSRKKRYPLIIMVHGGPENHISDGWLDKYSYPIKYAAARGFTVFLPNYRGSTGRGVIFSKLGQADYAGAEFNDLVDAIGHLANIGLINKRKVGITGVSYGGYASAWAATASTKHFAASVMLAGISDQISKFGTTDIPREMVQVHARSYPWERWQWMLERSPIYYTDKAKTPLLIVHGEEDTRVHSSQSLELYRYIKSRTKTPVRLVLYPDEGHGLKNSAAQLDYSIRLMRWMEFYLKGEKKRNKIPPYQIDYTKY